MNIKKFRRLFFVTTQTLPAIIAAMSLSHVVFYSLGIRLGFLDVIYSTSVSSCLSMVLTSAACKMCWVHRGLIIYSNFVTLVIMAQRAWGLGILLIPIELFAIASGTLLLSIALIKRFA